MNTRSCFFIGHREADEKLLPVLKAEVQRHIEELGVTEFIVGHYGGFDHLAVQAVCAAKKGASRHLLERVVAVPSGRTSGENAERGGWYLLSTWNGAGAPAFCHRPGQSLHGGPCGFFDCLCVAYSQQCPGTAGVCAKTAGEGPAPDYFVAPGAKSAVVVAIYRKPEPERR